MSTAFFCRLSHEGMLAIQGIDSKKFLQGQLTCNLNTISLNKSSFGARCSAKGRIVSSFRIIEVTENSYLLCMDQQLIEKQQADLAKFAIFSKVTLSDATGGWTSFGLQGEGSDFAFLKMPIPEANNQVTTQDSIYLIKVSDKRFALLCSKESSTQIQQLLVSSLEEESLNSWLLGQVQAGIGQVFAATSELFIPQMINLPSIGGVSFKKGCYTGQEIVARMQYLGKLKRHLYRFMVNDEQIPEIGTALFSSTHKTSVGEVVLAATNEQNKIELLAVVQDDAASSELWLQEREQQKLDSLPLPYTINLDEEIKQ